LYRTLVGVVRDAWRSHVRLRSAFIAAWCRLSLRRLTNDTTYAEAIKLVLKVVRLMKAQDQSQQIADYVAELRVQFKAQRNFIKLPDATSIRT
jgi:hypothetical protein